MVKIYGGTGDADLYVKKGSAPTTSSYDCRPYTSGNTETCDMSSLGAGTYYIMVYGYRAVTGLTLERFDACATTSQGAYGDACASGKSGSHGTGTLSLSGGATAGVAKSATLHTVRTMPSSGDGLMSDQVAGFNWVVANKGSNISVINFSIGEDGIYAVQDNAITACVNAGIFVAAAAGNNMEDTAHNLPGLLPGGLRGGSHLTGRFGRQLLELGRRSGSLGSGHQRAACDQYLQHRLHDRQRDLLRLTAHCGRGGAVSRAKPERHRARGQNRHPQRRCQR